MEDVTKEPRELLEACLSWQPGSKPFELMPAARDFAGDDPQRIAQMRILGLILAKYREPVAAPDNDSLKKQ